MRRSHGSLATLLLSEILDMAAALGTLREHQRSMEARIGILEEGLLRMHRRPPPMPETDLTTRWGYRLSSLVTIGRALLWLGPRLLIALAIVWKYAEALWRWLLGLWL